MTPEADTPTLLAFFAHPDDEAFSCAGTLAAAASAGIDVGLICATRGEGGRDRDSGATGDVLARVRERELHASCAALGIRPPIVLGLPDGGLEEGVEALGSALAAELERLNPAAVITLGYDGAYGHRDHLACTRALEAVATSRDLTVLHVVFPADLFTELRRRLSGAPVPLAPPPETPAPVDYRVGTRAFRRQKLSAIAAHRSQLLDADPMSFLLPGLVEPLLDEECFAHASGPALDEPLSDLFGGA